MGSGCQLVDLGIVIYIGVAVSYPTYSGTFPGAGTGFVKYMYYFANCNVCVFYLLALCQPCAGVRFYRRIFVMIFKFPF